MTKAKINPQIARQLKQMNEEVVLKEDRPSFAKTTEGKEDEVKKEDQEKIVQMKAQKETWARKRIKEIEEEIKILAQKKQEEMRKRREEPSEEVQKQKIAEEQKKKSLPEVTTKPKRGLPFWGKRIKTAQQQAQPETAARRVGG